jgi:hypothetical protein
MSAAVHVTSARAVLEITSDEAGIVTLEQSGAAMTFADRDAIRVAKAILAAAGYHGVQFFREVNRFTCLDVYDDDLPDAINPELLDRHNRPAAPAGVAPTDLFGGTS